MAFGDVRQTVESTYADRRAAGTMTIQITVTHNDSLIIAQAINPYGDSGYYWSCPTLTLTPVTPTGRNGDDEPGYPMLAVYVLQPPVGTHTIVFGWLDTSSQARWRQLGAVEFEVTTDTILDPLCFGYNRANGWYGGVTLSGEAMTSNWRHLGVYIAGNNSYGGDYYENPCTNDPTTWKLNAPASGHMYDKVLVLGGSRWRSSIFGVSSTGGLSAIYAKARTKRVYPHEWGIIEADFSGCVSNGIILNFSAPRRRLRTPTAESAAAYVKNTEYDYFDLSGGATKTYLTVTLNPTPVKGNLLVVSLSLRGGTATISTTSGWTQLTGNGYGYIYYKIADGTETTFRADFDGNMNGVLVYAEFQNLQSNIKIRAGDTGNFSGHCPPYANEFPRQEGAQVWIMTYASYGSGTSGGASQWQDGTGNANHYPAGWETVIKRATNYISAGIFALYTASGRFLPHHFTWRDASYSTVDSIGVIIEGMFVTGTNWEQDAWAWTDMHNAPEDLVWYYNEGRHTMKYNEPGYEYNGNKRDTNGSWVVN